MTATQTISERPLPVVLKPAPDERLSSWLCRHATFYGLTEPMLISWLNFELRKLRGLDTSLGIGHVARLVDLFRCDPKMVVGMTHTSLSAEMAAMVGTGKAIQFCRACHEQHKAAAACGAVLKSWHEGWRITCPVCGSPLSEGARPRSGDDTIRDASPFSKNWKAAIDGEEIVNRHLNGGATPLASPVAMMRLLLILSCRHADATVEGYRKSWLLNEIVPGFNAEALRVSPSISKGATAVVPLHLRIALLAGLAIAARDVVGTLRHLRPACRPFYLRRFDELASFARGWPDDFSI